MSSIYQFTLKQLENELLQLHQKPFRAKQIYEWLYEKNVYDFNQMTNIAKALRETLAATFSTDLLSIEDKQVSTDGTIKYLLKLDDGGLIETVLMIHPYGRSLCVTSQLGCNMGCRFCASGLLKKQRNLASHELMRQVLTVAQDTGERISHVVIMGTGEPFDNYDEVMNFVHTINEPKGLAIGARHITVSTCGLVEGIRRLEDESLQINLAISLHASNDEVRNELMPINKAYPMDTLREAMAHYIKATNRRVTLEYILLKDVNDDVKYARQLAHYLRGLNAYVNLIPYNAVNELGYSKTSDEKIQQFKDELLRLHINCTLRKEHGSDIDGACGQLRAKRSGGEGR